MTCASRRPDIGTMAAEPPSLNRFDGPLDLLLQLINQRALDITTISLAAVAEEYLAEVARLSEQDLERLSSYLVIASNLLLIKSRLLLPQPALDLRREDEVGDDLVRQVEEYRRYKAAAQHLRRMEVARQRMFSRPTPLPVAARPFPGAGSPVDLAAALRRALAVAPPAPPKDSLGQPRFTVAGKLALLMRELASAHEVCFSLIVARASCRSEVVALFLALLELVRRGRAVVCQRDLFGEILLAQPPQPVDLDHDQAGGGADRVDEHVHGVAESRGDEGLV